MGMARRCSERSRKPCAEGSSVASTVTRNRFAAAPVYVAIEHLKKSEVRYLLINAGNANAGTGQRFSVSGYNSFQAVLSKCEHS